MPRDSKVVEVSVGTLSFLVLIQIFFLDLRHERCEIPNGL